MRLAVVAIIVLTSVGLNTLPAAAYTGELEPFSADPRYDLTGDGRITQADVMEVLISWETLDEQSLACTTPLPAPAHDLDGDGCDDFFVGALRYQRTQPREGAAFVYLGSRTRRFEDRWFRVLGKTGSWYGAAGASAGDVNGDGFLDFIVAAPSWDTGAGANVGQVELFLNTRRR